MEEINHCPICDEKKFHLVIEPKDYLISDQKFAILKCDNCGFLLACKKNGWKVHGIEPSEIARNYAINRLGLNVSEESEINKIQKKSFSVISLWHVLEHVHDLEQRLNEISLLLVEDGVAII